MNYLVFLDTRAGELEKILSGVKTMLVKEFDPAHTTAYSVFPGDSLYFLRDQDDCTVRVKAIVGSVLFSADYGKEDLPRILKEMQPRLQLTELQYNDWSAKQHVLLVEFNSAQKIGLVQVNPNKITDRSDWIAFEEFSMVTE